MNTKLPHIDCDFKDLPSDPKERLEAFLGIFGHHLVHFRDFAISLTKEKYPSPPDTAHQKDQELKTIVGIYSKLFLAMLQHRGFAHRLGSKHFLRFKLELQVMEDDGLPLEQHELFKGTRRLADYWVEWCKEYGSPAEVPESIPVSSKKCDAQDLFWSEIISRLQYWKDYALDFALNESPSREFERPQSELARKDRRYRAAFSSLNPEHRSAISELIEESVRGVLYSMFLMFDRFPSEEFDLQVVAVPKAGTALTLPIVPGEKESHIELIERLARARTQTGSKP